MSFGKNNSIMPLGICFWKINFCDFGKSPPPPPPCEKYILFSTRHYFTNHFVVTLSILECLKAVSPFSHAMLRDFVDYTTFEIFCTMLADRFLPFFACSVLQVTTCVVGSVHFLRNLSSDQTT